MRSHRSRFAFRSLLVVLAVALVAAACADGSGDDPEQDDVSDGQNGDEGDEEESSSEEGIKTIRFLNQETDPDVVRVQRGWVERFVEENPDSDVILEGAPADVINQRIATYIQAGAPLDVLHGDGGSTGALAADGQLEPLDDVVEALGGRDAFLPGRLLEYEGSVYAINQVPAMRVLHYRTDLFEEANLEVPETWEELLNAAEVLDSLSDDISGIAIPGGENRATTIHSGVFLWQACGDFFDSELNVTLDTPQAAEALEMYASLLQYAPDDVAAWSWNEPPESFLAGRSAMLIHNFGLDLMIRQNPDLVDNVALAPLPADELNVTEQGSRYLSIASFSDNTETAKAWIEFMLSAENAVELSEVMPMLYPPTTQSTLELLESSDADTVQAYGDDLFGVYYPQAERAYNQVVDAGGIDQEDCVLRDTNTLNPYVQILWNSNLWARAVQQVAFEGASPADAAAEAHENLSARVEEARDD